MIELCPLARSGLHLTASIAASKNDIRIQKGRSAPARFANGAPGVEVDKHELRQKQQLSLSRVRAYIVRVILHLLQSHHHYYQLVWYHHNIPV